MLNDRRCRPLAACHDQSGFGQAVTSEEILLAKAAGRKHFGESIESTGSYWFGPVEGRGPTAEIERWQLFGTDLVDAKLIGEIGPPAERGLEARDRLQPPQGAPQKRGRRHQSTRESSIQGLKHPADQAHIVVDRE